MLGGRQDHSRATPTRPFSQITFPNSAGMCLSRDAFSFKYARACRETPQVINAWCQ